MLLRLTPLLPLFATTEAAAAGKWFLLPPFVLNMQDLAVLNLSKRLVSDHNLKELPRPVITQILSTVLKFDHVL